MQCIGVRVFKGDNDDCESEALEGQKRCVRCLKERAYLRRENASAQRLWYLIKRQDGVCTGCDRVFSHTVIPTVDHIVPRSLGGSLRMPNLQALCFRCNNLKGAGTMDELWERLESAPVSSRQKRNASGSSRRLLRRMHELGYIERQ